MKKREFWILAAVLAIAVAMGFGIYWGRSIPTGSWGLSFQQEGAAPIANATREKLMPLDAAYLGNPEEKVLYLTFDAGYENGNTGKILDALKKHNAKGPFSWWATSWRRTATWFGGWPKRGISWETIPCTTMT